MLEAWTSLLDLGIELADGFGRYLGGVELKGLEWRDGKVENHPGLSSMSHWVDLMVTTELKEWEKITHLDLDILRVSFLRFGPGEPVGGWTHRARVNEKHGPKTLGGKAKRRLHGERQSWVRGSQEGNLEEPPSPMGQGEGAGMAAGEVEEPWQAGLVKV